MEGVSRAVPVCAGVFALVGFYFSITCVCGIRSCVNIGRVRTVIAWLPDVSQHLAHFYLLMHAIFFIRRHTLTYPQHKKPKPIFLSYIASLQLHL